MNKYPTVNYIGNKEKIADWIVEKLPITSGTVVDLFCGGCSVSYALKKKGFNVISNDALYSNYVLAKAIIENDSMLLEEGDFNQIKVSNDDLENKYKEIDFLADSVYFDYEVKELSKLINISYHLDSYKKFLYLALLRRAMIRKIPYSRMNVKWEEIQKFRDEEYSYQKYGRYRHYHNITFMEHILLNLEEYNDAVFKGNGKCIAFNNDSLEFIENFDGKIDLIYMDPPYPSTMNKYGDFYGKYDLMLNVDNKINLDLTNRKTFIENFLKIVKQCCKVSSYIAISLNNKCYPSHEILIKNIKDYILWYKVYECDHTYKVTGKKNKNTNKEILLVCKLKGC